MTRTTNAPSTSRTGGADVASWVAATAIGGTVLIALGAFWLSFTALTDLAARAGIPSGQAWVWPLIVDGVIVVATISVVALAPHGRRATWYPWTLLVLGAVVSVAGNATHAGVAAPGEVPPLLAAGIAAVPPLVLLAVTHLTVELTSRTTRRPRAPRISATPNPAPKAGVTTRPLGRSDVVTDRRERARGLRRDGWSNRRIAEELGVHASTVGRWLTSA